MSLDLKKEVILNVDSASVEEDVCPCPPPDVRRSEEGGRPRRWLAHFRNRHEREILDKPPLPPHKIRGDYVPFGLIAFGMALLMVVFLQTEWTPGGFAPIMMTFALFSGIGQFIVGIIELIKGSNFAGSVFAAYGCFWMNFFFFNILVAADVLPPVSGPALTGYTLWLCLWGVLTIGFGIFTLRMNGCMQFLFGTLILTFFTLAGGNYSHNCALAAGYIGLICGLTALYSAFAILTLHETGVKIWGLAPRKYIP